MFKNKLRLVVRGYRLKLLLLIIFLIPFTDTRFLPLPGEFNTDLALNLALVVTFFYVLKSFIRGKYKFVVSTPLSFLYLLMIWILIGAIINFDTILISDFKNRTGLVKFIWQGFILVFTGFFFTNYLMTTLREMSIHFLFKKIRSIVLIGFIIVFIYAIFEIIYFRTLNSLIKGIIDVFDMVFLLKHSIGVEERLSSIMFEPPFLAIYLVFTTPWILSYMFDKKFIIALSPILLGFISGSRTSLIISLIQLLLFGYYFIKIKYGRVVLVKVFIVFAVFLAVFYVSNFSKSNDYVKDKIELFSKKTKSNSQISNVSRWGTQLASYRIWKENPIFGIGFSQQGFHLKDYYSDSDYRNSYEIRFWSDTSYPTWPPGFSVYTRLLAETGIVGLIIFLFFLITLLRYSYISLKMIYNPELKILALILFVCNIGFIINYMQFDSFRLISFWIITALTLTLYKSFKNNKFDNI
jgi:hypothetical protein